MDKYQQYSEFKDSGVKWLGDLPSHWQVKKLKFQSSIQPSNIDKKSKDVELQVELCNYTDVYYNEHINVSLSFMKATATEEQIKRFTLRAGDTIITKDSEDPSDIAIPSYVPENLPGVVCGYHLAIIRPKDSDIGGYVKRVFETGYARSYFATRANGLTRYGLGTYPLSNVYFPAPPKDEAKRIAAFLDHETTKIDRLIARQERLIELLKEKRQAVISHAVTKGLNPDSPMKDSGVEWLGEVPAHWVVAGFKKYLESVVDYRGRTPEKIDDGVLLVTARNIGVGEIDYSASQEYISPDQYEEVMRRGKPLIGDVLFVTEAPLGEVACVDREDIALAQRIIKFCGKAGVLDNYFLKYFIMSTSFQSSLTKFATGSTALGIKAERLVYLRQLVPPPSEQKEIVEYIDANLSKFDLLIGKTGQQVTLLKEHRNSIISSAVTGKIDVRGWQKPDTEPVETATAVSS